MPRTRGRSARSPPLQAELQRLVSDVERAASQVVRRPELAPTMLHDLHRRARRLGVALAVWERILPPREATALHWLARRVKRLARLVGQVRDRDVTLELIAHAGAPGRSGSEALRAHRFLARTRDEARTGRELLRVHLRTEQEAGLFVRLHAAVAQLPARSVGPRLDRMMHLDLAERHRRVRKAHRKADRRPDPERLHRLRIRVRQLHHAADLGRAVALSDRPPVPRALRTLQRRLGRLHDIDLALASLGPELRRSTWARALRAQRRGERRITRRMIARLRRPLADPDAAARAPTRP